MLILIFFIRVIHQFQQILPETGGLLDHLCACDGNFMLFSSLAMSNAPVLLSALAGIGSMSIFPPLPAGATPGALLLGLKALPLLVPLASAVLRLLTSSGEKGTAGGCRAWAAYVAAL